MEAGLVAAESADDRVDADALEVSFESFRKLEQNGLAPDRRIYSALVRAFGLKGDIASAVGVFEELRERYGAPDVSSLQSLLDVCLRNPTDVRMVVGVLARLEDASADLDVYSQDVLMQGFPDAVRLGRALESMESQVVPPGCTRVRASFAVLSALSQAARREAGIASLEEALDFLGRCGILPDEETMDYFRMPTAPGMNSPNSRHHNRVLIPNQTKKRSLMNMDTPREFAVDLSVRHRLKDAKASSRPLHFEAGEDVWQPFVTAMARATFENSNSDIDDQEEEDDIRSAAEDLLRFEGEDVGKAIRAGLSTASLPARDEPPQITPPRARKGKRRRGKTRRQLQLSPTVVGEDDVEGVVALGAEQLPAAELVNPRI